MSIELRLRPLVHTDIDEEYCSWYDNVDGHLDYFTGSGRSFTRESIIEDFQKGSDTGLWHYFLALNAASGERIGNVKIGPIDLRNRTSDLVCLIGNRSYLGKGLAPQIIAQANVLAFETFDIRRLHGGMYATNVASIKAYTRAGWAIEAQMQGYYLRDGEQIDRVCVCCLNPRYFPDWTGGVTRSK